MPSMAWRAYPFLRPYCRRSRAAHAADASDHARRPRVGGTKSNLRSPLPGIALGWRGLAFLSLLLSAAFFGPALSGPALAKTALGAPTENTAPGTSLDQVARDALEKALDEGFVRSGVPGVAVGIWIPGKGSWVATRGVADLKDRPSDDGGLAGADRQHHEILHGDDRAATGRRGQARPR